MEQPLDRQYSLVKIIGLWLLVTVPMGIGRYIIMPMLADSVVIHPGIIFWLLMILGMIWQFVLSVIILKSELGSLSWVKVKERLWLNHPIDSKSGKPNKKLYWYVIPVILYAALIGQTGLFNFVGEFLVKVFPSLAPPPYVLIKNLATPEFAGAWYIVVIALVSSVFNYLLGEELFFRGILLPKMNGTFGKFDWAINGVLFATYHVHKIQDVPVFIFSTIFIAYLNKKYRSFYPALIIHGIEFLPLIIIILMVVLGKVS